MWSQNRCKASERPYRAAFLISTFTVMARLLQNQLKQRLRLDNRVRANNPLMFFKDKQITFPRLCKIVPQTMCAARSTAAVERVFSVAGYILSPKRMSLSDENFENQLFSNLNRNVFQVPSDKLKL